MQFPYVHICAILSDDRINDGAVKPLITKEAQERDVIDPGGLKEAAAFERIRLLCFLYFCDSKLTGLRIGVDDLKGFSSEEAIWEHDGHPGEISADIKPYREIGDAFQHLENFLIVHNLILSGRYPIPEGGYTT